MAETPAGFFRFGMAQNSSQITVRLDALVAIGEVTSIHDSAAEFYLWMVNSNHPLSIGYGSRSGAEHDRSALLRALDEASHG